MSDHRHQPVRRDHRKERLAELEGEIERAWQSGDILFLEEHPKLQRLIEEHDDLEAEIYPGKRDPFQTEDWEDQDDEPGDSKEGADIPADPAS